MGCVVSKESSLTLPVLPVGGLASEVENGGAADEDEGNVNVARGRTGSGRGVACRGFLLKPNEREVWVLHRVA